MASAPKMMALDPLRLLALLSVVGCGSEPARIAASILPQASITHACGGNAPSLDAEALHFDVGSRLAVGFTYTGGSCFQVPRGGATCPSLTNPKVTSSDETIWRIESQTETQVTLIAVSPGTAELTFTAGNATPLTLRVFVGQATTLRPNWIRPTDGLPQRFETLAGLIVGSPMTFVVNIEDATGTVLCTEPQLSAVGGNGVSVTPTPAPLPGNEFLSFDAQAGAQPSLGTITVTRGSLSTTVDLPVLPASAVTSVTATQSTGRTLLLGASVGSQEVLGVSFRVESLTPSQFELDDSGIRRTTVNTTNTQVGLSALTSDGRATGQVRVSANGSSAPPVVVPVSF